MASKGGFRIGTPGASKDDLYRYLKAQGSRLDVIQDPERLSWTVERPINQTMYEIKAKLYSPFWNVPDTQYGRIVKQVEEAIHPQMANNEVERTRAHLECWSVAFD